MQFIGSELYFKGGLNEIFMKTIVPYFLITFIIFFTDCKKSVGDQIQLPPITQEGRNTFGCKVNGTVWVPNFKCRPFTNPCEAMNVAFLNAFSTSILPIGIALNARKEVNNSSSYFHFGTKYILSPPKSFITAKGNIYDSLDIQYLDDAAGIYNKISGRGGEFEITKLDTINKIISGTFNFSLNNGTDSVLISEGRFDFKLQGYCLCSN